MKIWHRNTQEPKHVVYLLIVLAGLIILAVWGRAFDQNPYVKVEKPATTEERR